MPDPPVSTYSTAPLESSITGMGDHLELDAGAGVVCNVRARKSISRSAAASCPAMRRVVPTGHPEHVAVAHALCRLDRRTGKCRPVVVAHDDQRGAGTSAANRPAR